MEVTRLCAAATPLSSIRKNSHNKYNCLFLNYSLNHRNHSISIPTFSQFNNNHHPLKVLSAQKGQQQLHVSGVDELYDALVSRLLHSPSIPSNPNFKHLVALAGPPGAGKSTLANEVASRVNKLWSEKASSTDTQIQPPHVAIVIPMDGFHLYRSELDAMEVAYKVKCMKYKAFHYELDCLFIVNSMWNHNLSDVFRNRIRRKHMPEGEVSSMDIQSLAATYMSQESTNSCQICGKGSVYVPSFDHGVGDPVEEDIFVNLQFIDIDIDKAMQRVLKRHISTGKPPEIAKQRVENNDRLNAEDIMKSMKNADIIIKSVDF
ncbi:hypothetical protein Lal_00018209 [Lupinus albus]|nr:hypothetical protein Lal_00018209 [Lupinus albus]